MADIVVFTQKSLQICNTRAGPGRAERQEKMSRAGPGRADIEEHSGRTGPGFYFRFDGHL